MSTLNVSNISDGTDTVETGYVVNGSAKAWVNFNGTGTPAIRDSLNASSLTDRGTGLFDVNITSAFANTSASCPGSCHDSFVSWMVSPKTHATTTSKVVHETATSATASHDASENHIAIQGDLA
jgi:hypothetical protein